MVPAGLPVKAKLPVPPTMTFFTVMVASFVFVKVQVTFSPAATLKLAARPAVLPVLSVSSQTTEERVQPGAAASVAV